MVPWVITREAQDGEPLVDALRARGVPAICLPVIQRTRLPWPKTLVPGHTDVLFLTSPYAAGLALEAIDPARPPLIAALLPATAAVVTSSGVDVTVAATGGAVGLARALLQRHGERRAPHGPQRLLYPTSDAGLEQPEQDEAMRLLARAFDVVREPVYSTRPVAELGRAWRALAPPVHAVVFSPSAARAIAGVVEREADAPARLVAVGSSTARALPFPATLAPAGADLVEFLRSLQEPA